jgi:hypothetical protein
MKRFKAQQTYFALIMLILSVLFITGCGSGGGDNAGGGPPTVTSVSPLGAATGVCENKEITATFSKAMQPLTVTVLGTFTVYDDTAAANVSGLVTEYNAVTRTATFTPVVALTSGHGYTATITTAAKDTTGQALAAAKVWSFTTGTTICAPPVDPGALAPFGIGSYGGITNTGATKINGNAVLSPNDMCNSVAVGAADNFGLCNGSGGSNPPTNNSGDLVITDTHPDTTTAAAIMVVLLAKWNSITMAGLPGGILLGCGTIGTGGGAGLGIGCAGNATLPPGIYISHTSSTIDITGDLTLDGQGDANAVFVFQVPSAALTATPGSALAHPRILLINGAKASNVWWEVGSSATLGSYSEFQGNILASASISMGTGATSCGRLLAGAEGSGAFTFLANTVSVPGHPNAPVGCE